MFKFAAPPKPTNPGAPEGRRLLPRFQRSSVSGFQLSSRFQRFSVSGFQISSAPSHSAGKRPIRRVLTEGRKSDFRAFFSVLLFALHLAWPGVVKADPSASIDWHFEFSGGVPDKLVWQSEAELSYDLMYSEDLVFWNRVVGYPKLGLGGPMEIPFTVGMRGFFKITADGAVPSGFAIVPAGSFSMGDSFTPEGEADEIPVHSVFVSGFYMGQYEVTKALWDSVRTWGTTRGYIDLPVGGGKAGEHPVHSVDWFEVVKWCNACSEMDDLDPCYKVSGVVYRTGSGASPICEWGANGYRLPTEAEWEKAARGGLSGMRFPWGDTIDHSRANYRANGSAYSYDTSGTTSYTYHPDWNEGDHPFTSIVGSFAPNAYGLSDMAGNVFELCWDWWVIDYYDNSPGADPRGPGSGSSRTSRGGSWQADAWGTRNAQRGAQNPFGNLNTLGFRLVRSRP